MSDEKPSWIPDELLGYVSWIKQSHFDKTFSIGGLLEKAYPELSRKQIVGAYKYWQSLETKPKAVLPGGD